MLKKSENDVANNILAAIKKKNIYTLHHDSTLHDCIGALEQQHLTQYPNSKIAADLTVIRELIVKLSAQVANERILKGPYLVVLTSIAKKLQELKMYHADAFVQLGEFLLQQIETKRKETDYLSCHVIEKQDSAAYKARHSVAVFSAAGPLALSALPLVNGIVVPFAQDEFKLFNQVTIGHKKHLQAENEQFGSSDLSNYAFYNSIQRYHLKRLSKIHKNKKISVFEATYSRDQVIATDENTIYVIGFHGNAMNAKDMLFYLHDQAIGYLYNNREVKNIVVVAPDYPGSAASGGKFESMDELALDSVVLVLEHLIKSGVSPARMLTIGHSLGGAVLVNGLSQLQKKGIITTAVSLNSFSRAQKFVGDSKVITTLFIKNYNTDASQLFQELPKHRRNVEHTQNDPIIATKNSLLMSLDTNKDCSVANLNEGYMMESGGHNLEVHQLRTYIRRVQLQHHVYQSEEEDKNFQELCKLTSAIILEQKIVQSSFMGKASSYGSDEFTNLGKMKDQFRILLKNLQQSKGEKIKILLGFLLNQIEELSKDIKNYDTGRSFFDQKSPDMEALRSINKNLLPIFANENFSEYFLTEEFLSECKNAYLEFTSKQDKSLEDNNNNNNNNNSGNYTQMSSF